MSGGSLDPSGSRSRWSQCCLKDCLFRIDEAAAPNTKMVAYRYLAAKSTLLVKINVYIYVCTYVSVLGSGVARNAESLVPCGVSVFGHLSPRQHCISLEL